MGTETKNIVTATSTTAGTTNQDVITTQGAPEKTFTQADVDRIVTKRLSDFADYDELKAKAEGEALTEYIRLDSLVAMEKLEPMLETNLESLEELRKIRRGERAHELKSRYEWEQLDTAPE